jgi:putative DNA methylase
VLDPFAGGGSIPLEAQRLGLDACGRDLNAVAVLINKALIEIPPPWRARPPIFPGAAADALSWPGATGLAEDVQRYGQWIFAAAHDQIGHMYPAAALPGSQVTVIAWIWARTVTCPNPACRGTMPLIRSFRLSTRKGKQRYIEAIPHGNRVRFTIGGPEGEPRAGTISGRSAVCLLCGSAAPLTYVRAEGAAKRIGSQLMAIVAQGKRQRYYLPPEILHEKAAQVPRPPQIPEEEIGNDPRNLACVKYGYTRFDELFTSRQLRMHSTLTSLVHQARSRIVEDSADPAYADAVTTYLALAVSRIIDRHSCFSTWDSHASKEQVRGVFARQSISMEWDYAEGNPFSISSGNLADSFTIVADCLRRLPLADFPGSTAMEDAALGPTGGRLLVATDPPYYDNISYANLSDFYYVWLRRSLGEVYPELMSTLLTAKQDEIVADPIRHGGAEAARGFYEERFEKAFRRICKDTPEGYPISFFYAYKQTKKETDGIFWTPWEILLRTLLRAGWMVTASWPIRTELSNRLRGQSSNALGSSVVLTCRPRPAGAPTTDHRGFMAALHTELPAAIRLLVDTGIVPVDLRQSVIGPGMKIFSRYVQVNEPTGEAMSVGTALKLINQVYDAELSQIEGDVSPQTRWCIDWFSSHGFDPGASHTAEAIATGANTDVASLERARLVRSRDGMVSLIPAGALAHDYNVNDDEQISEWKVTLHLARTLQEGDLERGARLLAAARSWVDPETIRQLAYWLYTTADKKGWAETAALFNALGTSWPDLESESRRDSFQSAQYPLAAD